MRTTTTLATFALVAWLTCTSFAEGISDQWRYTLRRPAAGWQQAPFDDSSWQEGFGGFGTRETPGSRVGTTWATDNIWLRKTFELENIPAKAALLIHHDENAEVFLNGRKVAALQGFTTDYKVIPISNDDQGSIKVGANVLAVHCSQTGGGQFIDVHLIDADKVPQLPEPPRSTKPFVSELITTWGEQVTPANAWTEYPRPQLQRADWTNLNGHWDYAVTSIEQDEKPESWDGKILVPYSLESKLGGVQRLLDASEALWYRRTFSARKSDQRRLLLNFEAVDYRCQVFVNGRPVGSHVGGNTPFTLDVSDAIQDGENELVVRVEDATEAYQLRGKQVLNARGIWYTQVSGIWQTVWLEEVPKQYIRDIKITPGPKLGTLNVRPVIQGSGKVLMRFKDGDRAVYTLSTNQPTTIEIDQPKLWSPASPFLYDIEATLYVGGEARDQVTSYVGIRSVGKVKDADGHWRFTLNGDPIFHWGPLDQGWWPDGLLTPPSDEAMAFDIEWLKEAGFNMIRKHIKVEPRRYYYHCDRLGMMVWQDHVSGGVGKAWPEWTRLKPNPVDANWPPAQHKQFMLELDRMITTLENHPSIVSWVPFNERWGQHRTMDVGRWTVKRDPSRLVNIASGGNFWPVGDVVDAHSYPHPEFPFADGQGGRFDDYIKVMGEFGGHGYPVKGHLWDVNRRNWGYGGLPQNEAEYKERYVTSLKMLNELRAAGIAAGVYTQTTDVEGEINGLMTYDRKVIKIPAKDLAELHKILFEPLAANRFGAKATRSPKSAFIEQQTDRPTGPATSSDTIGVGLKSPDRALAPNVIVLFIDDMGYADPSCFGNPAMQTPNIDRLAAEGIKLTNFYVNSPICSASRVALTTGQYQQRYRIHSFFATRQSNRKRNMPDWLDPQAPTLAKLLKQTGYKTAHFGKWHMGGGRDVGDAPLPEAYGFDESLVSFEGLGDRILWQRTGNQELSWKHGRGEILDLPKHKTTETYVDRAIDFIKKNRDKRFYVRVFPNDVHDGHFPSAAQSEKWAGTSENPPDNAFFAVLDELDRQIGRLLATIDDLGLADDTLILFTSDNGPTDWPRYYKAGHQPPGFTGPLFGRKWSLYEGGIRMPFIARWPGKIPPGTTNEETVMAAIDVLPTVATICGVKDRVNSTDGVDLSRALMGDSVTREKPICWEYGVHGSIQPGKREHVSPQLAIRDGDWKLLCNPDGSQLKLFDVRIDIGETNNLAAAHPDVATRLKFKLLSWWKAMDTYYANVATQ